RAVVADVGRVLRPVDRQVELAGVRRRVGDLHDGQLRLPRVGDRARLVIARGQRDRAGRGRAAAACPADDAGVVAEAGAGARRLREGVGANGGKLRRGRAVVADVGRVLRPVDRQVELAGVRGRVGDLHDGQLRLPRVGDGARLVVTGGQRDRAGRGRATATVSTD